MAMMDTRKACRSLWKYLQTNEAKQGDGLIVTAWNGADHIEIWCGKLTKLETRERGGLIHFLDSMSKRYLSFGTAAVIRVQLCTAEEMGRYIDEGCRGKFVKKSWRNPQRLKAMVV